MILTSLFGKKSKIEFFNYTINVLVEVSIITSMALKISTYHSSGSWESKIKV